MSNARECERCGKIYGEYSHLLGSWKVQDADDDNVDLCEECERLLINFIDGDAIKKLE